MDFLKANEPFAISALIIALGYVLKRIGVLRENDGETLARVALNVTLPAIILLNVPQVSLRGANATLPLYSLTSTILLILIGLLVFRGQERTDRGLSLSASAGYNIGLFAMPLVAGVYGSQGIARFALVDIGNIFSVFLISYYLAYRYSPIRSTSHNGIRAVLRMFLNSIPFLACITAVIMNLSGLRFTGFPADLLGVPAAMNRGVALMSLGVLLRFRFPAGTWKAILPTLFLRYTFGIAAAAVILLLFPIPLDNRIAIAGVLVMPVGLTIIPYAVKWGYDRNRAAAILNMGIPVSFILFWIVWAVGTRLGV